MLGAWTSQLGIVQLGTVNAPPPDNVTVLPTVIPDNDVTFDGFEYTTSSEYPEYGPGFIYDVGTT